MRSYETARSLFSFLAFVAWSAVIVGVLIALVGMGGVSRYADGGATVFASLPGLGISLIGLFQVAVIQNARATVDTAEYTQQMLKVARDQLEVSRQGLKQPSAPTTFTNLPNDREKPVGYEPVRKTSKASAEFKLPKLLEHKGKEIRVENGKYYCNRIPFETLKKAETYIDNFSTSK